MANLWYRGLHRFSNAVYFNRITLIQPERLPPAGPVLYLGLHRNGAVDGFVYHSVLPPATFLISTQLRKHPLGKLFFTGIEVVRAKDEGDRGVNAAAMKQCRDLLRAGGSLFVFPEGTSTLGPRHLPFKSGAAQILIDFLDAGGGPISVLPVGIHYECPWAFRGNVEVVVDRPVPIALPLAATPLSRLKEVKRRAQAGLERVGVNVNSSEYQVMIERFAHLATLGTRRSYFQTLKALEATVPAKVLAGWRALEPALRERRLWYYRGVPLFPFRSTGWCAAALAGLGLIVGVAILVNLPPLLAGGWAGKKFPDGRNVISLWRILVGVPVFVAWGLLLVTACVLLGAWLWVAAWAVATWGGLRNYDRVRRLAVAVHNGVRCPDLKPAVVAFHQLVLEEIPDAPA